MVEKLAFRILLLYITKVVMVNNVPLGRCPDSAIVCRCGRNEVAYFPMKNEKFEDKGMDCLQTYYEVCRRHSCWYQPDLDLDETNERRTRKTVSSKESSAYPIRVVYPPLDDADDFQPQTRLRRFPKRCNDSIEPIKHATLICTYWPEFVSCEVNCSHGYAIEQKGSVVVNTTRNCRESEHYWYPDARFPVCKPFLNCRAVLVKPGKLFCKTSGPVISYCDISCSADYSADEIPEKRYECTDGNYAKTLPHCATIDERVGLIKPPKV